MRGWVVLLAVVGPWRLAAASEEVIDHADEFRQLQELGLEELLDIVVTATKTAERVERAPSVVDVVSAEEIRLAGYNTVGEALRGIQGIAVIDDHVYWNVGVRGLYAGVDGASDIVKLMLNGQPVSFRPTNGNFFGHELVPIQAVKRIEVVRGPGSALYGANAFLGVINVITFEGADFAEAGPTSQVGLVSDYLASEHGGHVNGGVAACSGGELGNLGYFLAGNYYSANRSGLDVPGHADMVLGQNRRRYEDVYGEENGYPSPGWDLPTRSKMLAASPSRHDLERVGSLYGVASYTLKGPGPSTTRVAVDGNFQSLDRHGEFQNFSYLTHRNRITYANWYGRLRIDSTELTDGLTLRASGALSSGRPTDDEHIVDPDVPEAAKRRLFGYLALDGSLEATYALGETHTLTAGVDYTHDTEDLLTMQVTNGRTGEVREEEGFGDKTFRNTGAYGQWVLHPLTDLGITLGARFDRNSVIACDAQQWDCLGTRADVQLPSDAASSTTARGSITDRGRWQMSSRAAAVYAWPAANLYTKIIYGTSFKPPSPYQLFHEPINIKGTRGYPYLKPQSADTVEAMVGYKNGAVLHATVDLFRTTVTDMVQAFKEKSFVELRNVDVSLLGLEAMLSYRWHSLIVAHANATVLLRNRHRPKRRQSESDLAWQVSEFNVEIEGDLFPRHSGHLGLTLLLREQHANVNVDLHYVGERSASPINNGCKSETDCVCHYAASANRGCS